VNPAVLFPVVYGLIDEVPDTPAAKRQLILIAKVLQNLANGVKFGQKEAFMIPLNDFIESNQASYRKFLEEISRNIAPKKTMSPGDVSIDMPIASSSQSNLKSPSSPSGKEPLTDSERLETMKPEITRQVTETSLALIYQHVFYNRDGIIESLRMRLSKPEFEQFYVKFETFLREIGEPVVGRS